jgi:helicase required for RNAi-mediated heterochromatin assembly 1
MNEHLPERFRGARRGVKTETGEVHVWILPQQLNPKVRQYFEDARKAVDGEAWLERPEVPTTAEVLVTDPRLATFSNVVAIVPNKPIGAWKSKGQCHVTERVFEVSDEADWNE